MSSRSVAGTEAMEALGRELGARLRAGDLVVLTGPLGAGKTTLTRGIGAALNVRGPITSPTFVLARTHPALGDGPDLVHVDAYRLGNAMELDDLDIDYESSVVVAEWGRGLIESESASGSWLEVVIARPEGAGDAFDPEDAPEEPRTVTITGYGPRWEGMQW
ncbi:tRNA (adenosine(37)-N6)-threonylcarbamoyltransferase complex ATPase subunit type 1 TsaE [Gryllotalpicola koreensis]|uniref:tRNA threonylcarbamoyladenosine biosynthesis protein TsaE n=1 Tax=Gryllotalpicola koreensis TaxID=993086 RepID=A0ABP8A4A2_9MICO